MIYRTREILRKRHRAILPFVLGIIGKALFENMKKAAKGEEADATINPLDVVKGIKEFTGEDGEIKVTPKDTAELQKAIEEDVETPEIVESDRTFEEQLAFTPEVAQGQALAQARAQAPNVLAGARREALPELRHRIAIGPEGRLIIGDTQGETPGARNPLIVPGPEGRMITGQGEGRQPTRTLSPERPPVPPGILQGLKESLLNQPSSREEIASLRGGSPSQGRETAFDVGSLIGDIIRQRAFGLSDQPDIVPFIDPVTGKTVGTVPRVSKTRAKEKEPKEKKKTRREKQEEVLGLIPETNVLQGESPGKRDRARVALIDAKKLSNEESITEFLRLNPDF